MDIDDDYQSLSPPKELSPQVQFRRLKRSKKSDDKPPKDPLFDSSEDILLFPHVDFAKLEALENGSEPQVFDESNSTEDASFSQESLAKGAGNEVDNGDKIDLGFDVEVRKTKRVLQFGDDVVGGSDESGTVIGEDGENFEPEMKKERITEEEKKNKKKRREKSDGGDESKTNSQGSNKRREDNFEPEERIVEESLLEEKEEKKKNKKKRTEKSDAGDESKTNSRGFNKRREEKERKAYLQELHAESQRLLRESGDASFKPIPVVQKPISSVLEKIRKRKLEISKKFMVANDSNNHVSEQNIEPRDRHLNTSSEERSEENVAMTVEEENIAPSMEGRSSLAASNVDEDVAKLTTHENVQNQVLQPANEEPTPAFRAPVDDTQDLFDDSEPIGATTVQDDEKPNSPMEDDFAPSLQAMDLKLDSGPVDDSSEEEDNDKENFDPHPRGVADNSSPNGNPVKNFIDEEAEEEDDSDNDLNRFQENEADEDIDDFEELNDMIATTYEERPADKETRNELHQKWLEQQDAAGTDNLIQRLKCGSVLKDTFLTDDESEADEDDENDEEIDDEADEDSLPKESGRINIRKAKQIILQLYSDKKEDTYLSDGDDIDDDMQRRRAQYLIRKEEQTTISLPADDASSREVFGLIKKLNIASDNKRKPKASSVFDSVLKGGSSGQYSKSSFLGRVSNHHIPSSHKQKSATFRSFIFGREDSSSRSSISVSEDSSDPAPQEIQPTKNLTSKYSNSQSKVRNQTTDGAVETISRTSLLEILKRSSSETKIESAIDLTKSIFAPRAPKKPIKIEGRS